MTGKPTIRLTGNMKERVETYGKDWKDEGDGYASLWVQGKYCVTAYVALPAGHPCLPIPCDRFDEIVRNGFTYHENNVFGWDYWYYKDPEPEKDIASVIAFFKAKEQAASQSVSETAASPAPS